MRTALGIAALLGGVLLVSACGSDTEAGGDARTSLEETEAAVDTLAEEALPALADALDAELSAGGARFESCTMGVGGDVDYVVDGQFGPGAKPEPDAVRDAAAALREQGWSLEEERTNGVRAERDGVALSLTLGEFATDFRMESDCVDTSKDLAEEYTEREEKDLSLPAGAG